MHINYIESLTKRKYNHFFSHVEFLIVINIVLWYGKKLRKMFHTFFDGLIITRTKRSCCFNQGNMLVI